ncbi:MAG: lipopolysaccharide kinase InaA family protein [Planctomycetes bacterium]|nr:lipopolysaccharide kinase InaA family protein [Planctomycetota bacterium]
MSSVLDTPFGRVRAQCDDAEQLAELVPTLFEAFAAPGRYAREIRLGATPAWFKGSALRGRARLRHGLRARILRRSIPRENEYRALVWLRERLFQAPRPLVAGALERWGFPTYQFLVTELVPNARALDVALAAAKDEDRTRWLAELARETARMHALHFVHRDLFTRNVLVAKGGGRELWFIDCWRGGDALPGRDAAWDLGCLMLDGATFFRVDEQRAFFEEYFAECARQRRTVDRTRLLERAGRARANQLARVRREHGRWRYETPPAPEWDARAFTG